ncbi:MAG: FAD-dependent monooxygenase [Pseudomonadota bacterium]
MEQDADTIIVGGGLNGCAMALAAAQAGISSVVIDRVALDTRSEPGFDGRSYALALASKRMLGALGLWDALSDTAQPILKICASDGRPGAGPSPLFLTFDHAEIEEGPMGFLIEDRDLRRSLLTAMADTALITHRAGDVVTAQATDGGHADVTLGTGERLRAALLIGADGRQSGVAQRAGIGRTGWAYDQTALVCAVAHERPHNGEAHQFFMPGGPLAILPLTGNRASIVWSERTRLARRIAALDDAEFLEALRPRFGDFLGELTLMGDRFSYPLNLTLANKIVAPRLALIGDAAQGIHPIAGQGLNQGLRDIGSLAQVLADARRRGEDLGMPAVLERHRQWRSFDRAALAVATDSFNRLFSNDNPLLRLGRDIGLGVVSHLPGLRRRFIREAAGLTGDVPKLLQGLPL